MGVNARMRPARPIRMRGLFCVPRQPSHLAGEPVGSLGAALAPAAPAREQHQQHQTHPSAHAREEDHPQHSGDDAKLLKHP